MPSRSIESGAGIIDSDFRGNVKVTLDNLSDRQNEFETRDRIAQIVFQKVESPNFVEVSDFNDSVTERNEQGFGSTEVRIKNNEFFKWLHRRSLYQTMPNGMKEIDGLMIYIDKLK